MHMLANHKNRMDRTNGMNLSSAISAPNAFSAPSAYNAPSADESNKSPSLELYPLASIALA